MQTILQNFLEIVIPKKHIETPPAESVWLAASSGRVLIGGIPVTPELARKLALELPALATIAERLEPMQ